jgi:hypothetical protein
MPRFKNVDGVDIQLTPEEETARNAEEATWEEDKPVQAMARLRTERNTLLTESDWTQYNDSPLTDEVKAEWTVHRQALRDLPANTDDPANPTWPEAPE